MSGAATVAPAAAGSAGMSVEHKLNCTLDDLVRLQRRGANSLTKKGKTERTTTTAPAQQRSTYGTSQSGAGRPSVLSRGINKRGGRLSAVFNRGNIGRRGAVVAAVAAQRNATALRFTTSNSKRGGRQLASPGVKAGGMRVAALRKDGGRQNIATTARPGAAIVLARATKPQQQQHQRRNRVFGNQPSLAERLAQPLENTIFAAAASRKRTAGTPSAVWASAASAGRSGKSSRSGRLSAQRKLTVGTGRSNATGSIARLQMPKRTALARSGSSFRAALLRRRMRVRTSGDALRIRGQAAFGASQLGQLGGRNAALLLRGQGGATASAVTRRQQQRLSIRRGAAAGINKVAKRKKRATLKHASISTASAVGGGKQQEGIGILRRGRGNVSAAGQAAAAANLRSNSSNSSTVATAGTPPRRARRLLRSAKKRAAPSLVSAARWPLNTSINRQAAWAGGAAVAPGVMIAGNRLASSTRSDMLHVGTLTDEDAVLTSQQYVMHPAAVLRGNNSTLAAQQQRLGPSDMELMSKIKIMATLEKVPPPSAAQRGLAVAPPQTSAEPASLPAAAVHAYGLDSSSANGFPAGGGSSRSGSGASVHLPYQSYAASGSTALGNKSGRSSLSDRFSRYAASAGS